MSVSSDSDLRTLLEDVETIAVIGCSSTAGKAAHDVPAYMLRHGYDVIPVNPVRETVLDREAVDSLAEVDRRVGLVNVFRPGAELAGIVDEVLDRPDDPAVWTQLGIRDGTATDRAVAAGLTVVEDRCIKVEHDRLLR
jgi:predicted CoA-binding protein